jgi:pimeloyl-ACP methyl ester carboxylesterase
VRGRSAPPASAVVPLCAFLMLARQARRITGVGFSLSGMSRRGLPRKRSLSTSTGWGLFGASTAAAAALVAAARPESRVEAVVWRGGRPDFAGSAFERVRAATLLVVGGAYEAVPALNEAVLRWLRCEKSLVVVPGASHFFPEKAALSRGRPCRARPPCRWQTECD